MADADEKTEVRSVIDVDILGHIFEQSITDLERPQDSLASPGAVAGIEPMRSGVSAERRQLSGPNTAALCRDAATSPAEAGKVGRCRKQEGAVYTPAFITR